MDMTKYEYITVEPMPLQPGRKTTTHNIYSSRGDLIGWIEWYGAWRQYCLCPGSGTVWSDGCLVDVRDYMARLKAERTAAK